MKYKKKVIRKVGLSNVPLQPKGIDGLFPRTKTSPNFQNVFGHPNIAGGFRRKVTRMNRSPIKGVTRFNAYLMIDFI